MVLEKEKYNGFIKKVTEATSGNVKMSDVEEVNFYRTKKGVQLF